MTSQAPPPTVLVVDDEDLFRSSVRDALEVAYPHFRVLEAANGEEALEHLDTVEADVVLTDINMPVMDGFTLLLALRDRSFDGSVITVTAFGNPRLEREVQRSGAFAYVEKPVELRQLLDLVQETAERRTSYVEGLALQGFVQLISLENRSCRLKVSEGDRRGTLVFEHGRLVHAAVDDLVGDEAARKILGWDREAHIELTLGVRPVHATVETPLDALLISAAPHPVQGDGDDSDTVEDLIFKDLEPGAHDGSSSNHHLQELIDMGNVKESLDEAMKIEGAIGISLVDYESGMTLGKAGGGDRLNLDIASAGNTAVVRAKLRVMKDLGLDDTIEDILISLGKQYHIIRPLQSEPNLFLYFALDRELANLGMARHRLTAIEKQLAL